MVVRGVRLELITMVSRLTSQSQSKKGRCYNRAEAIYSDYYPKKRRSYEIDSTKYKNKILRK
ncbi:MAG: hypothetical protein AWU58_496 [Methanohalophilus sp. T328-1]|nr:MAG: hypothetical protein AWU58_496 [Methanohalophilus sp. T328-1]